MWNDARLGAAGRGWAGLGRARHCRAGLGAARPGKARDLWTKMKLEMVLE